MTTCGECSLWSHPKYASFGYCLAATGSEAGELYHKGQDCKYSLDGEIEEREEELAHIRQEAGRRQLAVHPSAHGPDAAAKPP